LIKVSIQGKVDRLWVRSMDERSEHLLRDHTGAFEPVSDKNRSGDGRISEEVHQTIKMIKAGIVALVALVYLVCWLTGATQTLKGMNPAELPRCVIDRGLDLTLNLTLVVWSDPSIRWFMKVLSSFMIDATFIASMTMV